MKIGAVFLFYVQSYTISTNLPDLLKPLFDILYPPKCGVCGQIGQPGLCPKCRNNFTILPTQRAPIEPLTSLHAPFLYDGEAGTAILNLKFRRTTSLAEPMSALMWEYAQKHLAGKYDVIIPVPIARTRKSERGFNQAELLCTAFPPDLIRPSYLKRTRYTRPQVNLDRQARLTNLQGAFETTNLPLGVKVLLIDDVVTTGGTAIACGEALISAGAGEVHLLTFASQPLS